MRTPYSRIFTIDGGAGPSNAPQYQGLSRAQTVSWPQGDRTPVRVPSRRRYGSFDTIDQIRGAQGLPTLGVQFRFTRDLSDLLALVRKQCNFDVQVHIGACKDPTDFNGGWEKILVLEGGAATSYDTEELGALDADQDAAPLESAPITGLDYYEIKPLIASALAAAEVTDEVIDVVICDSLTCGECGVSSDGCQVIFAIMAGSTGSPGLPAEVVFSDDGGATWQETNITTLAVGEAPNALACVGTNLVVVSEDSESLHYAPIADILLGTETWTEVTTGFVAAKGPLAIFSLGRTFTWIVAEGGYIYFSDDITAGVDVQSAGSVTTQNLVAIHGIDENTLVAVGASNAVLLTTSGGNTWASVTGPAVGIQLNTIWMRGENEWLIGTNGGELWYTRDGGDTWTEKGFSGAGAGVVRDIKFSSPTVGYMAHDTATPSGRLFRTVDGGNSWYTVPESTGTMPANDRFNKIAACEEDVNVVFAGGLGDNGTDGIMVKAA
jgi:photosystem II stability/assembly factor-like uncharacterized protein